MPGHPFNSFSFLLLLCWLLCCGGTWLYCKNTGILLKFRQICTLMWTARSFVRDKHNKLKWKTMSYYCYYFSLYFCISLFYSVLLCNSYFALMKVALDATRNPELYVQPLQSVDVFIIILSECRQCLNANALII